MVLPSLYYLIQDTRGQKFKSRPCPHDKAFELETRQKHEDAAIFKENQRIRMFLELRKLHRNGAIRGYQLEAKKYKDLIYEKRRILLDRRVYETSEYYEENHPLLR